jgi:dTDP-4-amino-4,6-dideoxygalactose transaminase
MPYYQSKRLKFPVAEKLFYSSISLPIFPGMTNEQIEYIIEIIKTIGEEWHK